MVHSIYAGIVDYGLLYCSAELVNGATLSGLEPVAIASLVPWRNRRNSPVLRPA